VNSKTFVVKEYHAKDAKKRRLIVISRVIKDKSEKYDIL